MDSFLPTTAAAAPAAPVAAAAPPNPAAFQGFASLAAQPAATAPAMAASSAPMVEAEPCAVTGTRPKIELQETDGRVTRIIVTCGCGERTAIECVY